MLRRALHHRRAEPVGHDARPTSPPNAKLPKVSDRKAVLGCLAAVLASMHTHEIDDGDEEDFFSAYDAHCTVHADYEKRSSCTGGSPGGTDASTAENEDDEDGEDDESDNETDFYDLFGNRKKLKIAISRHKRRKYEVKMDLLRWSTRLMMLDEADATALMPMLKPLLSMSCSKENFCLDEILQPFLCSLSSGQAAFECIALLLFNYLLVSSTMSSEDAGSTRKYSGQEDFVGYDARIRHAFKRLAVAVFFHVMMKDYAENRSQASESMKRSSESKGSVEPKDEGDGNDMCDERAKRDSDVEPKENDRCHEHAERSADDAASCSSKPVAPRIEPHDGRTENILCDENGERDNGDNLCDENADRDTPSSSEQDAPRVEPQDRNDLTDENAERGADDIESQASAAAVHKFEALEHTITAKLLALSEKTGRQVVAKSSTCQEKGSDQLIVWERKKMTWQRGIRRAAKVASAGVVAGSVFALTGGLAAPGIAATVAMFAGGAAATAAVVTLTSTLAVSTLFGFTGGVLCAAKMTNRVQGLKEFTFKREECTEEDNKTELSRAVCVSGWLRDMNDFRRPWGVVPGPETTLQEKLERFYYVHFPEKVTLCEQIAEDWEGREEELWELLRETYGQDPDSLLPFKGGPRQVASLCEAENNAVNAMTEALGYSVPSQEASTQRNVPREQNTALEDADANRESRNDAEILSSTRDAPLKSHETFLSLPVVSAAESPQQKKLEIPIEEDTEESDTPAHLSTFWDYHSKYGGELYTVQWESELLWKLTSSVARISGEFASTTTLAVLNETALNALSAGISLPSNLLRTLKVIDGPWALACKRSEQAGRILARSLLESDAGHRPVTLVGFSLGARLIYSCLRELALHQERWEYQREQRKKKRRKKEDAAGESDLETKSCDQVIDEKKEENCAHDSSSIVDTVQRESDVAGASQEGTCTDTEEKEEDEPSTQPEEFTYLREPASIIEDAILVGCPAYIDLSTWAAFRRVVAGRLINCHHPRDMVLLLIYQYECISGLLRPTCGTHEIKLPGVENYNVSNLVSSHSDYCLAMDPILSLIRYGQPEASLNPKHYMGGPAGEDEVSTGSDDIPPSTDDALVRARLIKYYHKHCPPKAEAESMDLIMKRFRGRYDDLDGLLKEKYGVGLDEAADSGMDVLVANDIPHEDEHITSEAPSAEENEEVSAEEPSAEEEGESTDEPIAKKEEEKNAEKANTDEKEGESVVEVKTVENLDANAEEPSAEKKEEKSVEKGDEIQRVDEK